MSTRHPLHHLSACYSSGLVAASDGLCTTTLYSLNLGEEHMFQVGDWAVAACAPGGWLGSSSMCSSCAIQTMCVL